jgi:hypothetical protein
MELPVLWVLTPALTYHIAVRFEYILHRPLTSVL